MKLTIYIDGACRFNPGPAGIGVWIVDANGCTVSEISEYLGQATNNIAEWSAYLRALQEARKRSASDVTIFTDSQLLAEQVQGNYKVRDSRLKECWHKAKGLESNFANLSLCHIDRENNKTADRLAKRAIKGKTKESGTAANR